MRTAALIMKRKIMAQALISKIAAAGEVNIFSQLNYELAETMIISKNADTAVIEAAEDGEYNIVYCLKLCERLRKSMPKCKILLLCPEQNKADVSRAIAAKQNGIIDDFVFYDTGLEYLVSKMLSI